MSGIPDRKTLEAMKRVDLQRLCKDHGLKANLKSEALIDLLIETSKPLRRPPTSIPKRSSSLRIISKSSAGSRPRDRSGGSVIIHDSDVEAGTSRNTRNTAATVQSVPRARVDPTPPPPVTRNTRKAKETQYRLGVGRPALAGGSGARAVTKSISGSKAKRARASISAKPSEADIPEEEESTSSIPEDIPQAGPSGVPRDDPVHIPSSTPPLAPTIPPSQPSAGFQDLKAMLSELVNPLREQVQALQTELQSVTGRLANAASLELKVTELTNEVASLRSQSAQADRLAVDVKSLQERLASVGGSNVAELNAAGASSNVPLQSILDTGPGQTITALGKRHRSEESDLSSALEMRGPAPRASQPVYQEHPPSKKRPRLAENARAGPSTVQTTNDADEDAVGEDDDFVEPVHIIPGPPFTVFSGQEEPPEIFNPPPPTTRLSDLFPIATPSALSNGGGAVTSTANAPENQIPPAGGLNSAFNFVYSTSDFQPMTSTPAGGHFEMGGPSFPFPEPPTSPTPGHGPTGGFIERGGRRERNDLFRPHGAPSRTPSRSSRPRSSASNRARSESQSRHSSAVPPHITSYEPPCISPAALMRTPILPAVPESEPEETPQPRRNPATILGMGIGVGMVGLPIQMPPDTPAPPLKRTMYGTELDADTRFGDFGVEGVAMGFWTGAAHRV